MDLPTESASCLGADDVAVAVAAVALEEGGGGTSSSSLSTPLFFVATALGAAAVMGLTAASVDDTGDVVAGFAVKDRFESADLSAGDTAAAWGDGFEGAGVMTAGLLIGAGATAADDVFLELAAAAVGAGAVAERLVGLGATAEEL